MKRKSLRRISISTTPEAEDAVAEWLSGIFGAPASIYSDAETGISTVSVYLRHKLYSISEARGNISTGLKRIKSCGLKTGSGKIVIAPMRHKDWAESWKRHFKPFEIKAKSRRDELYESLSFERSGAWASKRSGTRITRPSDELKRSLLIKPSWSKRNPRKGQVVIVLDPGLSFGTGHHPTTAFCLGEIARRADASSTSLSAGNPRTGRPRSFLDLGTGSGILAIAAAKLGYSPVLAVDFDPEAVRVARANARANRVHQKLKILYGDVTKLPGCPRQPGHGYDLVCANLTSDLLITERRRIAAQLNHSGTLVLAGILKGEFAAVQRAYEALELKLAASRSEAEWRSGSFCFRRQNVLNNGLTTTV